MSDRERRQRLCAAYGGGQIKQALIAGEYPPPDVLGKTLVDVPFEELERNPAVWNAKADPDA